MANSTANEEGTEHVFQRNRKHFYPLSLRRARVPQSTRVGARADQYLLRRLLGGLGLHSRQDGGRGYGLLQCESRRQEPGLLDGSGAPLLLKGTKHSQLADQDKISDTKLKELNIMGNEGFGESC